MRDAESTGWQPRKTPFAHTSTRTDGFGRTYLTPLITGDVLRTLTSPTESAEAALTFRQRDALRLLAQGKRMQEIAAELDVSVSTVENHKSHLCRSCNLETIADLVRS